eukprot:TRINITY_DN9511_c2_g1_i2.p4 TRINITY_DN9511_c2_g1~~TRINITY_DN9511_c2_g1_i2.p4  ORF type:complete len:103 (-),score=16.97 TRINITY_DN9511_c2_g1_i2:208-516(-)
MVEEAVVAVLDLEVVVVMVGMMATGMVMGTMATGMDMGMGATPNIVRNTRNAQPNVENIKPSVRDTTDFVWFDVNYSTIFNFIFIIFVNLIVVKKMHVYQLN